MELRTLRYFIAAAQEGSLVNASKRLHITQPTLSRQLADLERELGRQLFLRTHGGTELTEYGAVLLCDRGRVRVTLSGCRTCPTLRARGALVRVHFGIGFLERRHER